MDEKVDMKINKRRGEIIELDDKVIVSNYRDYPKRQLRSDHSHQPYGMDQAKLRLLTGHFKIKAYPKAHYGKFLTNSRQSLFTDIS